MTRETSCAPRSRDRKAAIGFAFACALAFLAHGPGARAADVPYVVGFTDVLSGANAALGTPVLGGAQVYFNAINAKGGINGHKIDFRPIDSQADATKVVTAIQDLQGAGAVAIMGMSISGNAEAAAPIANQMHVPLFSGGLSAKLLNPFEPYVFSSDISTASLAQIQIDFIRQYLLPGKSDVHVALYSVQTAGVQAYVVILKQLIASEQPGWKIVDDEVVPLTINDAGVPAAKIVAAKPDVVIGSATDNPALLGVKAMVSQGLSVPILNTHAGNAEKTILTSDYPGYYAARQYPTTEDAELGPGYRDMIAAFKTAGLYDGLKSSYNAITGYSTALQISAILKACGETCTGEKMAQATLKVGSIDNGGITFKPVVYGPSRHQGVDTVRFYHAVGGKLAPVGGAYSAVYGQP